VQGLALSKRHICAHWRQKQIFPSVKAHGGGAMTDALLMVLVLGVIGTALAVDLAALLGWLRRRWQ